MYLYNSFTSVYERRKTGGVLEKKEKVADDLQRRELFLRKLPVIMAMISFVYMGGVLMALEIKSTAFERNDLIPAVYTCKGTNISPTLSWSGIPARTKSFALICGDPDAPVGIWVHWVIYNIPEGKSGLPEAVATDKKLADGTLQGLNDFRRIGYSGPCPPPGPAHRYSFKLYALDTVLDVNPGLTKKEVLESMEGHVLEEAQLMGKFGR